jgi:hypothetical protein
MKVVGTKTCEREWAMSDTEMVTLTREHFIEAKLTESDTINGRMAKSIMGFG